MSFRGYVSSQKGMTFPERWKQGPDNEKRIINRWFIMARAQATYRQEPWQLTFEDYYHFWHNNTDKRGKKAGDLTLRRIDNEQPWSKHNCELVARAVGRR